jgi:hypothetical protein
MNTLSTLLMNFLGIEMYKSTMVIVTSLYQILPCFSFVDIFNGCMFLTGFLSINYMSPLQR